MYKKIIILQRPEVDLLPEIRGIYKCYVMLLLYIKIGRWVNIGDYRKSLFSKTNCIIGWFMSHDWKSGYKRRKLCWIKFLQQQRKKKTMNRESGPGVIINVVEDYTILYV